MNKHDPNNKECAQAGYGDNYHGLGKIECTCPAQKEEWVKEFEKTLLHRFPYGFTWKTYPSIAEIKSFIASQITIARLEERSKMEQVVQEDEEHIKALIKLAEARGREATITAFEEEIEMRKKENQNRRNRMEAQFPNTMAGGKNFYLDGIDEALTDLLSFASCLKSNAPKV